MRSPDPATRVRAVLAAEGLAPWTTLDLCREAGLAPQQVRMALTQLEEEGALVELPVGPRRTVRVLAEVAADLEDRALRALGRLHAARPRHSTIPRAHLVAELPDLPGDALVAGVLERLRAQGKIVGDERAVMRAGHEPKLSQGERKLKHELAEAIAAGGLSPPDITDLAARAGPRAGVLAEILALLVDEGQLVEAGPHFYLDLAAEGELRRRVAERLADGSAITMAELRDLLGTTRKYAVPIGEYLDRIGFTRREGDLRRLAGRTIAAQEAS
jgi:selenocysteine-specific elongation factor